MQKHELEKEFEKRIKENELLIYKVCRVYETTDANRQDLFQEIVIQLWKAYPKFKGESKFSTWLYRVAINTAITGLRKQKNFVRTYEPSTLPNIAGEVGNNDVLEEQLRQLYSAIALLNSIEKAMVMLYLEDRSYEEMEEILGMSNGNIRVKMSRIKDKLRQLTNNK